MGCDIHVVIERKRKGDARWTGILSTDALPRRPVYAERDYEFFQELASVRGTSTLGNYPQNVPEDISELAWQQYMRSPTDHHSASYMSAREFCNIHRQVRPSASRKEFAEYDILGIDQDAEERAEFRVVFWFDN